MTAKKERKLPNRTDLPFEITNAKLEKKHPFYNRYDKTVKNFTYTAASIPSSFLDSINEAITGSFFSHNEYAGSKSDLIVKARKLLDMPFTAGRCYSEFGAVKFPKNTKVQCLKCGVMIDYVVDFFIHSVLDHSTPYTKVELIFEDLINLI